MVNTSAGRKIIQSIGIIAVLSSAIGGPLLFGSEAFWMTLLVALFVLMVMGMFFLVGEPGYPKKSFLILIVVMAAGVLVSFLWSAKVRDAQLASDRIKREVQARSILLIAGDYARTHAGRVPTDIFDLAEFDPEVSGILGTDKKMQVALDRLVADKDRKGYESVLDGGGIKVLISRDHANEPLVTLQIGKAALTCSENGDTTWR